MNWFIYICLLVQLIFSTSACSSSSEKKGSLSKDDKVLFQIGECSRSRYNNVALSCLDKFKTYVFKGKVLRVEFAYSGVKSIVDIGSTRITCHSHPTDQNFQMLKELVIGDLVAVNGAPSYIHNHQNYNTLVLKDCLLLPIGK